MLLKISLGLAILVGLVTLYISQFQVGPKIQNLTAARDQFEQQKTDAQTGEAKAKKEAETAQANLAKGLKDLSDATNALKTVFARATEQEKRANKLAEDLHKTTEERNDAQREVAQWNAMAVSKEQVRLQRDALKQSNEERDGLTEENKILIRNNKQLRGELDKYTGIEREVPLPLGLKGKIIAVDPKWDFVVLDIGANQGVLQNGKMLVNRGGKLVAKVRIITVEPNRSIANILPDWKQDDVMEGDQVLY